MLRLDDYIPGMYQATAVQLPDNRIIPISSDITSSISTNNKTIQPTIDNTTTTDTTTNKTDGTNLFDYNIMELFDIYWKTGAFGWKAGAEDILYKAAEKQGADIQQLKTFLESEPWNKAVETAAASSPIPPIINISTPEIPDILGGLKDIGKWVGIGLLAVVGIWGVTKIFSRKK